MGDTNSGREWLWSAWGLGGSLIALSVLGPVAWFIFTWVYGLTTHYFGESYFLWMALLFLGVAAIGWRAGVRVGHRRTFGS